MDKTTFLEELKTLAANDDVLSVSREVNELRTRFEDFILEEERKQQVAVLEAKVNGETAEFVKEFDPIKDEFYSIFTIYKDSRKKATEVKNASQADSLRQKKALIARLRAVIETEENIGAAFNAYKEIHEAWKKVGDIPREKRDEIQAEYSRLLEDFFYNMKIYRELKDHDLHRNYQVKLEVVQQVKALLAISAIKDVEKSIKLLQNEWDETGPVGRDSWEELKKSYLDAVRSVYEKINLYYDGRRIQQQENLEKKQILLEKVIALCADFSPLQTAKDWEAKTQEIFEVQTVWKQIGFGPKKENEEIWSQFRTECDHFFAAKKEFFDSLRAGFDSLAAAKQKLIDQANTLKVSTDWKTASDQLVQLQKQWKKIGNAGQRNEQRLWKEFRAACDFFFDAKTAHYADLDKLNETNLIAKEELIAKIETFSLGENKSHNLAELKTFAQQFNEIGNVPLAKKDSIYQRYKAALDKHYSDLKLEGAEKEKILFQAKLDTFQASPNASRLLDQEKMELRRQIDTLKQDVIQYENNLGFFSKSKGVNPFKAEVEKKIEQSKKKIEEMTRKMKMIPNE